MSDTTPKITEFSAARAVREAREQQGTDGVPFLVCPECGEAWLHIIGVLEQGDDGHYKVAGYIPTAVCSIPSCRARIVIPTKLAL